MHALYEEEDDTSNNNNTHYNDSINNNSTSVDRRVKNKGTPGEYMYINKKKKQRKIINNKRKRNISTSSGIKLSRINLIHPDTSYNNNHSIDRYDMRCVDTYRWDIYDYMMKMEVVLCNV